VARLPSQYRTVVLLYYFRELSYHEIARQTGLSVGTISTHLHRAKNLLKQMLADKEVGAVEPH
ncbi:MAG: polymerase ECF-type sigma factor, partial [Firmicutes bacterium]|nr:polymerase ECF-type sigma factor [Bacillota bacterium]